MRNVHSKKHASVNEGMLKVLGFTYVRPCAFHNGYWLLKTEQRTVSIYPKQDNSIYVDGKFLKTATRMHDIHDTLSSLKIN